MQISFKTCVFGASPGTGNQGVNALCWSILAGLALGKPVMELESVMQFAELNQKPIAQLQCEIPNQATRN